MIGILTDYALIEEGEFAGHYGARIDDAPYVVMHHVDAFLLRLAKSERVEVTLNIKGQISKIMRAKDAAPSSQGSTRTKEQISEDQTAYNTKADEEAKKRKAAGFGEPDHGPGPATPVKEPENPDARIPSTDNSGTVGAHPETTPAAVVMPATAIKPSLVPALRTYTDAEVLLIRNIAAKNCTEPEFRLLMYMARTYGLDPLTKQIWAVKRNDRDPALIFAGRDGFLALAHRSGHFDGMQSGVTYETDEKGVKKPVSAWCKIWRNDMTHPFETEVPFGEYNTGFSVWKTHPSAMILKVAESVCLRKAFSIHGVYCEDEINTEAA
jgi:phage recombination protein Bet